MATQVRILPAAQMKFFRNTADVEDLIRKTIATYGSAPEHNYYWYEYCGGIAEFEDANTDNQKNVFVLWPDGSGLLTKENSKEFFIFSEPLAPLEKRIAILNEYLREVLESGKAEKVTLELETAEHLELVRSLAEELKALPVSYILTTPIMDLAKFDPELPGKKFKYIRKAEHKFKREHEIEITDAKQTPKKELHALIDRWKEERKGKDRAVETEYRNIIEGEWRGTDHAHVFMIDGVVRGLNAGWRIPNKNRYYAAIGVHDYSLPDFGTLLYLEDLRWMKRQGHREADMGGGEETLTEFKNKFGPSRWYKTEIFTIVKK
ncbi:MAG: GNAT family N-acetyltransferase [Nanoarchaeota archaeon]|nr:GNAT family N-acetyltransferase [Nanoarchaeota archaeon]